MKALYFRNTGSLDNLRVENVELPRIDADGSEALVRVRAAAINPSDPKSVLGKISETKPPRVPGRDFAGTVVEGPAAWKGKEVFGTGGSLALDAMAHMQSLFPCRSKPWLRSPSNSLSSRQLL
jgi:NADPH:quinone reductase-like Zn-dependent oxidoreductase